MKIDCQKLTKKIIKFLKSEVKKLKKKPKIALFYVGNSSLVLDKIKKERKLIKEIGGESEFYHFKKTPLFEKFFNKIKEVVTDSSVTGFVIYQPLPAVLQTQTLYDYLPQKKEIEGFQTKKLFLPPKAMAILFVLKYIFSPSAKTSVKNLLISGRDKIFFKSRFKKKKVLLITKNEESIKLIRETLSEFKINHFIIHQKTPEPEFFFQEADVIITAVGEKGVIIPSLLKRGVILINLGIHQEKGKIKGDFEEKEIKNIAGFYTVTPGGIDILESGCLLINAVESAKLQQKKSSSKKL